MIKTIQKIIRKKIDSDIFIIGKGESIFDINLSALKDKIVININDSELIYPGDICFFYQKWVLKFLKNNKPQCKVYITNLKDNFEAKKVLAKYIPHNPDNADFLIDRIVSREFFLEQYSIASAINLANKIGQFKNGRTNVYLLGFDFKRKKYEDNKVLNFYNETDIDYQTKVIKDQEKIFKLILSKSNALSIKLNHIGNKNYSVYSINTFNKVFSSIPKIKVAQKPKIKLVTEEMNKNDAQKFKVKITAEITTNHFGDINRLKAMIYAAKESGADYIKLQRRNVDTFYTNKELISKYDSPFGNTFLDYRKALELNNDLFLEVDQFCKEVGINWFTSILDLPSFKEMIKLKPKIIKLPSTISRHKDYIKYVAKNFRGIVVISTGYTNPSYEKFILKTFKSVKKIYLLQCTSAYPAPIKDLNISVVSHYRDLSKINKIIIPGYSSHDTGSLGSMLAIAAGARMIEKHVKLGSVSWSHFDEVALDLNNNEFKNFVMDLRKAEMILGEQKKKISSSEHHKYKAK